jgi:hypothetical protein
MGGDQLNRSDHGKHRTRRQHRVHHQVLVQRNLDCAALSIEALNPLRLEKEMGIERVVSAEDAISIREWFEMTQRVKDHHLLLYGEDGQSGFVRSTQDFMSQQNGAYTTIQGLMTFGGVVLTAILAIVAYATFIRGH